MHIRFIDMIPAVPLKLRISTPLRLHQAVCTNAAVTGDLYSPFQAFPLQLRSDRISGPLQLAHTVPSSLMLSSCSVFVTAIVKCGLPFTPNNVKAMEIFCNRIRQNVIIATKRTAPLSAAPNSCENETQTRPSIFSDCSFILYFKIFPAAFIGKSGTNMK